MLSIRRLMINILALAIGVGSGNAQGRYPLGVEYPPGGAPSRYDRTAQSEALSQAMLNAHNAIRSRVGLSPLVWSAQLAEVAQEWANHLIASGGLSHRPDNRYGENIYTISGGRASPAEVVDLWAAEARGYDIRSNSCRGVCGHYTQIVWAKTRAVGCAVADNSRREVWVCNYDPPGNVIGYRPY
jgi:uncharacterized protein YkwD